MATNVIMPQMGESVVEGTVSRWLKQEGDPIAEFEPIVEVETDKVTSEIPAPADGVLLKIVVPEGQTVNAGTVLAFVGEAGEALPEVEKVPAVAAAVAAEVAAPDPPRERNGSGPHVTPVVARIAAEHGVDLSRVPGSGRGGRVTKKDIMAFLDSAQTAAPAEADLPPWEQPGTGDLFKPTDDLYASPAVTVAATPPAPAAPPPPPVRQSAGDQLMPLNTMRRRIAEHMVLSKLQTAPHVTTVFEADMSAVAAHRSANKAVFARQGIRLTFTAHFVAAVGQALREYPLANSQWTADGVLLKGEVNVGMAVGLEDDGLIVPVIKRVDELSLLGVARQVNDLADRARRGVLQPDDISGGTFTITNHGITGSLFATPIISQPQSAILGIGAIQKRVMVLENDAMAVRPMVYLSLSFDHRVLDGMAADRFMARIKALLEAWS